MCFPRALGSAAAERFGVDRLNALLAPIETVRGGGTVSLIGVYAGARDPPPMMDLFDKGIQLRMGQAQVTRWIPDILPLVEDDADPLGTDDVTTHRLPLTETPHGYDIFH